MADVGVTLAAVRSRSAAAEAGERFFNAWRTAAVAFFLLFAITFDEGQVHEDGVIYFAFLRRFFGTDTPATAYQFGSTVWDAPFFLVSQLVASRGGFDRIHAGEIAIAVASNAAVVATLYCGWRILRDLDLPRGAFVLLVTLFGTNLFFYGAFVVSYKHAADTLYATFTLWFVLRSTKEEATRWDFLGAGLGLGLLLATRFANLAYWIAIVGVFAVYRRWRPASWMVAGALATTVVLFGAAALRHIPTSGGPGYNLMAASDVDGPAWLASTQHLALSPTDFVDPVWHNRTYSAAAPILMLFTRRRGLFVWTPLTAFATVGLILLLRRDVRHRAFLVAAAASAVTLDAIHALWGGDGRWMAGGSFSQRFLTSLFPVFLIGTAELVRRFRGGAVSLLVPCACFSLFVGLVQFNGYYNESARDSIVEVIASVQTFLGPPTNRYHKPPPYNSVQNLGREILDRTEHRWQIYWRAVTGQPLRSGSSG